MKETNPDIDNEILKEGDWVVAIVEKERVVFHNRGLEEMTGFSAGELNNLPLTNLFSEKSLSLLTRVFKETTSPSFPLRLPAKILTKAKKELETELCILPYKKDKFIIYFQNITGWQELRRNEFDVLGKISHEILNPLSTIKESISILEEKASEDLTPFHRSLLRLASEEAIRLERIAKNLIDVSRITRGKVFPRPTEVNIKTVIVKAVNSLQLFIQKKKINLIKEIPDNIPNFWADPDQLSSIVLNLLDNAIKFSPEGEKVIINVSLLSSKDKFVAGRSLPPAVSEALPKGKRYILVSVTDFGPGIDEESKGKIFEMFERGKLTEGVKGIGIGLAIVKEFVHSHKGEIWVESKKGFGSTFSFVLPLLAPREVIPG